MMKTGKRIWALLLAVGMMSAQITIGATAQDTGSVGDSGQVDSGRAASSGAVQVIGFTLAFDDGTTPQEGKDKDYEVYTTVLNLHPQDGKELLLSGGDGKVIWVQPSDPISYSCSIRLEGDLNVEKITVGGIKSSNDFTHVPVDLSLNGGGHSLTALTVSESSHITITGGLRVNDIYIMGALTASASFRREDVKTINITGGGLLEMKDQMSADWLDRLAYYIFDNSVSDGQGRAIFSDREYIVHKNGVTCVSSPPVVTGVSPKGSGAPVSGSIVIDFNETMDTGAGIVTLTESGGSSRTLTGGKWNGSDNTKFTIGYSGLANSTTYEMEITDFKSAAGFVMAADRSHSFTTAAAGQAAIPAASPPGGSYSTAQNVTLTCATSGAAIYYTLDGSDPVTNPNGTRQVYAAPISVPLGSTLKAYATATGWTDSAVLTEVYTAKGQAAIPAASPPGGSYSTAQNVILTCATSGATIYYTLDGSDPVTNPNGTRKVYTAPISVPLGSTLKAYATATGWTDSVVLTEVYTQKSNGGSFQANVSPSGGSSSSGSSSGYKAPLLRNLKTAHITDTAEMRRLIAAADKNGWDFVRASSTLSATVKAEAWKLLADRRFAARTLAGGAVQVQLTFPEPWKFAEDMTVSGYTAGKEADRVRTLFEKWFANPVRVIHLEYAGTFGQPVEIAAKVDLTGLDLSQLHLYSYNAKTNSYKLIENPGFHTDQNGYLHFVTELAGDMIVSSGQLQRR